MGEETWETWNVGLWLGNREDLYHEAMYIAGLGDVDAFQEWVEQEVIAIDSLSGIAKDFVTHCLGRVDWDEVMSAFVEEDE